MSEPDYKSLELEPPRLVWWDNKECAKHLSPKVQGQRDTDPVTVKKYRNYMANGEWDPRVGTNLVFDKDGACQNGNHRLAAGAGLPDGIKIPFYVIGDAPDDLVHLYDIGKERNGGHIIKYLFPNEKDSVCKSAASIASYLMTYPTPGVGLPKSDVKPEPTDLRLWVAENHVRLFQATRDAQSLVNDQRNETVRVGDMRTYGFVMYHLPKYLQWFHGLAAHEYAPGYDPRRELNNHYKKPRYNNLLPIGARSRQITMRRTSELLVCWDAHRNNKKWVAWDVDTFTHPIDDGGHHV